MNTPIKMSNITADTSIFNGKRIEKLEDYPRISDLEKCIKETVVGQDELIKSIATSMYNSIFMGVRCVELIIGGTGTGKTLTMENFCKEFGMAYTIENATQYTQEGYKGDSVNQMLTNLVKDAGGDFEKAENGMLIIDEIGKKTSKGRGNNDGRDISGEGVIDSLLPILSGATINIEVNNRKIALIVADNFKGNIEGATKVDLDTNYIHVYVVEENQKELNVKF